MEKWQQIVREYDRKAHRKNGIITVTFTGSFRAIDTRMTANRVTQYAIAETHEYALDRLIRDLIELRHEAFLLDHRIELRKTKRPHERRYMYDQEE